MERLAGIFQAFFDAEGRISRRRSSSSHPGRAVCHQEPGSDYRRTGDRQQGAPIVESTIFVGRWLPWTINKK